MKTHITRHLLVLLAGATIACAADRVIPSDPGAGSGNTGAAGAGTTGQNMNSPAENSPNRREYRDPSTGNTITTTGTLAGPDANSALKRGDQRFFEKLARINEHEVALSRSAAERATTPQVRSFANEMVREHSQAGQELGSLATRKGARMTPTTAAKDAMEKEKDWQDNKGRSYDKAYLAEIIDSHEDAIDVLQNGADSSDPEIAAAAQKMLPKMKAHLERAQSLHKAID